MKILYVASNPPGQRTLLIEKEQTALAQSLARIDRVGTITIVSRPHIRIEELQDLITDEAPDALHIAAHMSENKLILSNEHDEAVEVDSERLADLLSAIGHRFKLIVINACTSQQVAQKLLITADFVIGTTKDITNRAARVGAVTLYGRLARAHTVQQAYDAARSMLRVLQPDNIDYTLESSIGKDPVSTRLAEPFRILASIPTFDSLLDKAQGPPNPIKFAQLKTFDIQYGVAGAPATAVQLVFFTDDPEIADSCKKNGLETGLSWIVRQPPTHGEIWIADQVSAWGDINWYAAITTGDARCFITKANLCNALKRYYLDEGWKGKLNSEWRTTILGTIDILRSAIGAKRVPPQV